MFEDAWLSVILTETGFKPDNAVDISWYHSRLVMYLDLMTDKVEYPCVKNILNNHNIPEHFISNETIEICSVSVIINKSELINYRIYRPHSGTIENFISE